jgi:pimeloyl-ACP methyl ester carboxylesterase
MTPCHVVSILTPKGVLLDGLLFGQRKPKNIIVVVHGLTGSAFSMRRLVEALTTKDTAVLTFNNRGFGEINSVRQKHGARTSYFLAGTAHEVFKDCVDDIQGAINFSRKAGAKRIFLAGHSTGAQKIMYWSSKMKDPRVKGLILFGPLSDYSGALATKGAAALKRSVAHARKLVAKGKSYELMPRHLGEWFACDAQRFLSLYTPESPEEIFSYTRPDVRPQALEKVNVRILCFLAGDDEYGDVSPKKLEAWFAEHLKIGDKVVIVPKVGHSFKGGERIVAREIKTFVG